MNDYIKLLEILHVMGESKIVAALAALAIILFGSGYVINAVATLLRALRK